MSSVCAISLVELLRLDHMRLDAEHHWQVLQHLAFLVVVLVLVVEDYLVDEVRIDCSERPDELEDQLPHGAHLFRLHQVPDYRQQLRVEEVRLDNEAGVLNHGDQGVQGHLPLLKVALVLDALEDQREYLTDVGLGGIWVYEADLPHDVQEG